MCQTLCKDCIALGFCRKQKAPMLGELKFYNEHPDQAIENLRLPDRILTLREALCDYIASRNIKPKELAANIRKRPSGWARKEHQQSISKTFNEANLRDFLSKRSNLLKGSRLLVHIYMWTTLESYRSEWGDFIEHEQCDEE
jgi:hypothetical protein